MKMRVPSLQIHLLSEIEAASEIVQNAQEVIKTLGSEWMKMSNGRILSTSIQSELQISLIASGLSEISNVIK